MVISSSRAEGLNPPFYIQTPINSRLYLFRNRPFLTRVI